MKTSKSYQLIHNKISNFPIRANFVLVLLAILAMLYFVKNNTWLKNSDFKPIVFGMLSVVLSLCVLLIFISFICVLLSYLNFKKTLKDENKNLQLQFANSSTMANNAVLSVQLQSVFTFLLRDIKLKLRYDKNIFTENISILNHATKKGFFRTNIHSQVPLNLPDIKEYQIHEGIFYFQDYFAFFSLPISFSTAYNLLNVPNSSTTQSIDALPKKATETQIRIDQLRRVDGEMLHYKKFDTSDDTRRIVWKIFAKNRELVVRTPEIFIPYASQIYMYASFYNAFDSIANKNIGNAMLNFYKNKLGVIYETLAEKNFEIKYIGDQEIQITEATQFFDKAIAKITLSNWQQTIPANQFVQAKYATIVCLHSLNNIADVEAVCNTLDNKTTVYFVKLSTNLQTNYFANQLMRIFVLPPKDEMYSIKNQWQYSNFKRQVLDNEKKMEALLHKQSFNFTTL